MTKEEIIKQLREDVYCRLKPSTHGVGVFAIKDIPKGTNPFVGCDNGEYVSIPPDELTGIDPEVLKLVNDMCVLEDGVFYLSAERGINGIDISYFLNHSREANMAALEGGADFVAIKDIAKGEELLVDYDTYDENESEEFRKE